MKKVKSLQDLQHLMDDLGAVKKVEPGFMSWTLDCGPGQKPQAPSSKLQASSSKRLKKDIIVNYKIIRKIYVNKRS